MSEDGAEVRKELIKTTSIINEGKSNKFESTKTESISTKKESDPIGIEN